MLLAAIPARRIAIVSAAVILALAAFTCAAAIGQDSETLTNADIIKMVQAHLGADVIVNQIQAQPGRYSLTTTSLIALKQAGTPDKVIAAMQAKNAAAAPPGPANSSPRANRPSQSATMPAGAGSQSGVTHTAQSAYPADSSQSGNAKTPPASKLVAPFGGSTLDAGAYSHLGDKDKLALSLIRTMPRALDDDEVLREFAILNNCTNPSFQKELDNELDYPQIAKFYKDRAPQILADLPSEITGFQVAKIGEYDSARGAFQVTKQELLYGSNIDLTSGSITNFGSNCISTSRGFNFTPGSPLFPGADEQYPRFRVVFKPFVLSELQMSDSAARQFIADEEKMHGRSPTGPVREVYLNARIQIPPIQPKVTISRTSSKIHEGRLAPTQVVVEFAGQIQEISVTKMLPSYTYNNDPIAILHPDAGSNPAPPGGGAAVPVVGARLPDNPVLSPSAAGQAAPAPYLQSETDPHLSPSEATEFEQKAMELYWKKQYQLAFSLSLKACSSGNQDACALEGLLYAFGLGISPDTRLAKTLMTGSCEAGDSKGCDALGSALLKGVPADSRGASIEKDPQKAIELFTNSCKGGYFDACVNLAQIYLYGIGAGQDALKASENLDQACKVGYEDLVAPCEGAFPEACRILSRCYSRGVGVKQDRGKAIQLLNQGCSKGDKASCNDTLDLR